MLITDIKRVVDQISREKGISREVLIQAIEEALKSAARKKYGSKIDIEVHYNEDTGEIEVFQFREVVETIEDPELEIDIQAGRALDPECEVGDSLGTKMDTTTFGRIAAQSAKQVIIQKMKDAERDAVYNAFIDRKGEIINGIVQRIDRGDIIVNLGTTEGALPMREQIPRENYRRGDRIRAYIVDVLYESRGPQIILSRTHPEFLIQLFKTEVPEISEGIVTIQGAAREPGVRAKFAVASTDSDIDPVGACVGMKGSRVQNVVQELRGEKIDIIPWHLDPAKYVCNSLAPAEISRVIIDEDNRAMEVIVPDEHLSIAIGKRGQNVRLASKLTKWHLDVISEERYNQQMQDGYNSLMSLPGVGDSMADALYEAGFYSAEELSQAPVEELVQIRGIGEEKAGLLVTAAATYVEEVAEAEAAEAEAEAAAETAAAAEAEAAAEGDSTVETEAATEDGSTAETAGAAAPDMETEAETIGPEAADQAVDTPDPDATALPADADTDPEPEASTGIGEDKAVADTEPPTEST